VNVERRELSDGNAERGLVMSLGGFAAENDFDGLGVVAQREDGADFFEDLRREVDVVGLAGLLVVKMGVGLEIRAIAGRAALEIDRPDEVALDEGLEAVIDGGERDGGEIGLDAGEDFVGGGVIAFLEENTVDDLALGGGPETAVSELLGQGVGGDGGGGHGV
jgi:hypothetical protein